MAYFGTIFFANMGGAGGQNYFQFRSWAWLLFIVPMSPLASTGPPCEPCSWDHLLACEGLEKGADVRLALQHCSAHIPRHKTDTCRKLFLGNSFLGKHKRGLYSHLCEYRKYFWGIILETCIRTLDPALCIDIVPVFAHPWCQYIKMATFGGN